MIKLFPAKTMRVCLFISALMFVITGCSTTTNIVRDVNNRSRNQFISIDQFNSDMSHRTVLLNLTDGKVLHAEGVLISGDSLYFRDTPNQVQECIGIHSIKTIQWNDRLGGALDGALLVGMPAIVSGFMATQFNGGRGISDAFIVSAAISGAGAGVFALFGHTQYYLMPRDTMMAYHDPE